VKAFFYVQHLLGIGHLKRATILARALGSAGFEVTLVSGGLPVPGFEVVQLPPAATADLTFKTLVDEAGKPVTEDWKRRRTAALLEAWRNARAQLLITELFPFGRRQMRFELLPLLETAVSSAGRPLIVSSVRDLIQAKPEREAEMLGWFERYYDHVLVHGDPQLAVFPHARRLGERVHYTGYVVDDAPQMGGDAGRGEVIVSAGGGAVGARLLETAIRARPASSLRDRTWRILAGAQASPADFARLRSLAGPGVEVERARIDFTLLLKNCVLSISQAGYNTVMETLRAGGRAVMVPFAGVGESEQTSRAQLLAARGLIGMVEEAHLSPETLAAAVDAAMLRPPAGKADVDLDGARRSAALLREWIS
jgi:predicted glycosyltransferase